ncbi:uncharacterized protein A1O5_00782 [Cladophialophora psammophila CBS 110553]|uniref:Fumarylacetoacetase-like C-terminal domain-containing protein n=1 Tax=Cladophialophora psammophila CBS 110553 TaxID=1182543 RepID=W9Y1B1_9EURO|nr:uncharacterized protein A1O5_00782 [Cladophialophora psammophila CBS 110553]EXJ76274.1 hypothetical protein A1O5_00782 [Cladophialophora psammophila CBS 110553]
MVDSNFKRLIRFEDSSGAIHYGEVPESHLWHDDLTGVSVPLYNGGLPWESDFKRTQNTAKIVKVLSPVEAAPIVYGIGLNYRHHAEEAKVRYLILNKSTLNLGYTVGNDVSSRYWQDPVRAGGQHGYAKAFDKFSPIGPVLVSTSQILNPSKLTLKTTVNGEQRQLTKTDDLIFDIPAIVRHLTRGRTVSPGTVVMTGTPSGVAASMNPPAWLKDGDVVKVEVSEIGRSVTELFTSSVHERGVVILMAWRKRWAQDV